MADEDIERVKRIHLLLAMYNAFQPGVFALSGWDLTGMLTIDAAQVADLIADGDTRWINRGAHDLMGANPKAQRSEGGLPVPGACTAPCPISSPTARPSRAGCAGSSASAAATASPWPARSTSPRSRTDRCW